MFIKQSKGDTRRSERPHKAPDVDGQGKPIADFMERLLERLERLNADLSKILEATE